MMSDVLDISYREILLFFLKKINLFEFGLKFPKFLQFRWMPIFFHSETVNPDCNRPTAS
jgi:hypothetical protein